MGKPETEVTDDVLYCPHCKGIYKGIVKQPNRLTTPLASNHKMSRLKTVYICDECAAAEVIAPMLDMMERQVRFRMELAKAKKRADGKSAFTQPDGGLGSFGAKASIQPESYFASDAQSPAQDITWNIDLAEDLTQDVVDAIERTGAAKRYTATGLVVEIGTNQSAPLTAKEAEEAGFTPTEAPPAVVSPEAEPPETYIVELRKKARKL